MLREVRYKSNILTICVNHTTISKLKPPDEQDIGVSCQLRYGSENVSSGKYDYRLAVTNLPGCNHVFGTACIKVSVLPLIVSFVRNVRFVEQYGGMKRSQVPLMLLRKLNRTCLKSMPSTGIPTTV